MKNESESATETLGPETGDIEEGKRKSKAGQDDGEKGDPKSPEVTEGGIADVGKGTKSARTDEADGEHAELEALEGEAVEVEYIKSEGEYGEGEHAEVGKKVLEEGEEVAGEGLEEEQAEGEETEAAEEPPPPDEQVEEEEAYIEEPPPDPAAPYDFSDSKEALKAPFELRPDQLVEVEQLWEIYQNYTPAYAELDGFITEKELIYMLKCLLLMTYTPEQLHELITYCCKPPHPKGHIFFEQFVKMVTIRQRDMPIEEELRSALQVFDPEKTGIIERDQLKEILSTKGYKMPFKTLDNLIKEVDMSNDGTIGIEDIISTMIMDLNNEDLQMLRNSVYPPGQRGREDNVEGVPQGADDED